MKRLQIKAVNEDKHTLMATDGSALYIDGNLVYSLHDGFVQINVNAGNLNNNTHG